MSNVLKRVGVIRWPLADSHHTVSWAYLRILSGMFPLRVWA